ncbi:MAG: barstar family protein [Gemmatimonadaceae bacterium]
MGFFRRKEKAPAEVQRLDWKLLERGAVALYYKPNVLSADLGWFKAQGYAIHELNAAGWTLPADFHEAAKRAFSLPSHYVNNLASWIDCIGEISVPDQSGTVVVFRQYDAFSRAQPQLAQTILDSIETTSRRFLLTGRRFLALVQSDDPRLRFDRVGAMPVTWNPREWLESDRGLGH